VYLGDSILESDRYVDARRINPSIKEETLPREIGSCRWHSKEIQLPLIAVQRTAKVRCDASVNLCVCYDIEKAASDGQLSVASLRINESV